MGASTSSASFGAPLYSHAEHKNFKTFLNHHRVNHATKLIDEGYLYKNSLYSLSLAAGFNSSQTFFRVFKDIQKKSPTKYSLEKNEAWTLCHYLMTS